MMVPDALMMIIASGEDSSALRTSSEESPELMAREYSCGRPRERRPQLGRTLRLQRRPDLAALVLRTVHVDVQIAFLERRILIVRQLRVGRYGPAGVGSLL